MVRMATRMVTEDDAREGDNALILVSVTAGVSLHCVCSAGTSSGLLLMTRVAFSEVLSRTRAKDVVFHSPTPAFPSLFNIKNKTWHNVLLLRQLRLNGSMTPWLCKLGNESVTLLKFLSEHKFEEPETWLEAGVWLSRSLRSWQIWFRWGQIIRAESPSQSGDRY